MATTQISLTPEAQASQDYRSIWYMGYLMKVHADAAQTNGQFALVEAVGPSGSEPPVHIHEHEDELFFVLEGTICGFRGGEEIVANAGQSFYLPRGVPHTFKILSEQARALILITPAGFEDFFRTIGKPAGKLEVPKHPVFPDPAYIVEVARQFGCEFVR